MKANLIKGTSVDSVNGRSKLSQCIPIDTPYTVIVCPMFACNFRCTYCEIYAKKDVCAYNVRCARMPLASYKKMIEDMKKFPHKIKVLNFCGVGEPLLNPDLPEMIRLAVEANVADTVECITNGALLTNAMCDALINSGLNRLKISIQGLDAAAYKKFSQVDIDFDQFVLQVRYFYEHRKNTKLYLKIIDVELEDHPEEDFYTMFGDMCDDISIEHLILGSSKIDYKQEFGVDFYKTVNGGTAAKAAEVCPRPFFVMNIHSDGETDMCCTSNAGMSFGNVFNESIVDVWNGKKANAFRRLQLIDRTRNSYCASCESFRYVMFPEDNLDDDRERLLTFF